MRARRDLLFGRKRVEGFTMYEWLETTSLLGQIRVAAAQCPVAAAVAGAYGSLVYREADQSPRCTACGNSNVTPPTQFDLSEGTAWVTFGIRQPEKGWLAETWRRFEVNRARVCLDCGHVMLAFGPERLEELRRAIEGLRPVGEKERV